MLVFSVICWASLSQFTLGILSYFCCLTTKSINLISIISESLSLHYFKVRRNDKNVAFWTKSKLKLKKKSKSLISQFFLIKSSAFFILFFVIRESFKTLLKLKKVNITHTITLSVSMICQAFLFWIIWFKKVCFCSFTYSIIFFIFFNHFSYFFCFFWRFFYRLTITEYEL